jgi:hypothetical protein
LILFAKGFAAGVRGYLARTGASFATVAFCSAKECQETVAQRELILFAKGFAAGVRGYLARTGASFATVAFCSAKECQETVAP